MIRGRTWRNVEKTTADEIRNLLLENGGVEAGVSSTHEAWRITFSDCTFTYYHSGTLYSTPPSSTESSVFEMWDSIDLLAGAPYVPPTKDFLVGLDETGKGEIIGHTILTGVIFPKETFTKVDMLVGPADTKKKHEFEYWDGIFRKLDHLRNSGFDFVLERIPPWQVDKYNLNKIMDVTYQRILATFFRKTDMSRCRIVLDDYGIGPTLRQFLNFLKEQDAEVIVTSHAENEYLEARTAALVSKRFREAVTRAINNNPEFRIDGLTVGSGNAGDTQTTEWLRKWHSSGREWPWFVKRSFRTVRLIEGRQEKAEKVLPPIRDELLSEEFFEEFNKGSLSIQALSVVCPSCGSILRTATFAVFTKSGRQVSGLRCPNPECKHLIRDAGITLRYYCGYVVPDSSVIQRNVLSKDLKASRFFEGFTVILTPVVRKECDGTPNGRREFDELRRYSSMGRVRLEVVGRVEDLQEALSGTIRDERIIESCLEHSAILLTADKSMSSFAYGKNVFTISI